MDATRLAVPVAVVLFVSPAVLGCAEDRPPMTLDCAPPALAVGETAEIVMRIALDDHQELRSPVQWSGPRHPDGGLLLLETAVEDAEVARVGDVDVYHFYNAFTATQPEVEPVRITVKAWYGQCCGGYYDEVELAYVPSSCELRVR